MLDPRVLKALLDDCNSLDSVFGKGGEAKRSDERCAHKTGPVLPDARDSEVQSDDGRSPGLARRLSLEAPRSCGDVYGVS